jgi:hypothetical protein
VISQKTDSDKLTIGIIVCIGIILWTYSIIRAWLLPLTGDEIYTYEYFVKKGIFLISDYKYFASNNHLLNTWLMEIFYKLFGDNDFVIRIPNLLAQILFLIYSGKLAMLLNIRVLTIPAFLILNLNPYLDDYFILARGYGISMGLMMVSLYFSYKFIKENETIKSAFISVLMVSIAFLSNFTLLNYLIVLAFLLVIINIARKRTNGDNSGKGNLVTARDSILILSPLSVLIMVIPILIKLKTANALYFTGQGTFWHDTVISLIQRTFDNTPIVMNYTIIFEITVALIFITSLALIFFKYNKEKIFWKQSFFVFIFLQILLCSMSNIIQHLWFGIGNVYERMALMYIPIFSLLMIFMIENIYAIFKKSAMIISGIVVLVMMINFIHAASLNRVTQRVWSPDVRDMVKFLRQNKKEIPEDKINLSIGINPQFEHDMNDYITIYFLTWLNRADYKKEFNPLNDYYFIKGKDLSSLNNISYSVLKEFPKSEMLLLENTTPRNHKEIASRKLNPLQTDNAELIYTFDDSISNYKYTMINFKAHVQTKYFESPDSIIIKISNNQKCYYTKAMQLEDYITKENEPNPINLSVMLPNEIKGGDVLKVYFYKSFPNPVTVEEMEFKIVGYNPMVSTQKSSLLKTIR